MAEDLGFDRLRGMRGEFGGMGFDDMGDLIREPFGPGHGGTLQSMRGPASRLCPASGWGIENYHFVHIMQEGSGQQVVRVQFEAQYFSWDRGHPLAGLAYLVGMVDIGVGDVVPGRLKLVHVFDSQKIAPLPGIEPGLDDLLANISFLDFNESREKPQNIISILLLHPPSLAGYRGSPGNDPGYCFFCSQVEIWQLMFDPSFLLPCKQKIHLIPA